MRITGFDNVTQTNGGEQYTVEYSGQTYTYEAWCTESGSGADWYFEGSRIESPWSKEDHADSLDGQFEDLQEAFSTAFYTRWQAEVGPVIDRITRETIDEIEGVQHVVSTDIRQHGRTMTDREALDKLALFMARPGQWNGGDVCEVAAEVIGATGRPHPGDSDYDTVDGVIDESGDEVSPAYINALAEHHTIEDAPAVAKQVNPYADSADPQGYPWRLVGTDDTTVDVYESREGAEQDAQVGERVEHREGAPEIGIGLAARRSLR